MIKKLTLLALSAAALVAFAVPAAAQASLEWSEPGVIEGSGKLTSVSQTGLVTGPASVSFTGEVSGTTGEITEFNIEGTSPTNIPGCTAVGTASGFPWIVHLTTPDTMVITNATFTNHYSGCPGSVPPSVPVAGEVRLTVSSGNSASADEYNDQSTMFIEGTNIGVDITGDVAWSGPSIE